MGDVRLVPHSPKEFPRVQELIDFLSNDLAGDGKYNVVRDRNWHRILDGTICVFTRAGFAVGQGTVSQALQPYQGHEASPVTGEVYAGTVTFDPLSISLYKRLVPIAEIRGAWAGVTVRSLWRLSDSEYEKLKAEIG